MKHAFGIAVRITLSAALLACCMAMPVGRLSEVSNAGLSHVNNAWRRCCVSDYLCGARFDSSSCAPDSDCAASRDSQGVGFFAAVECPVACADLSESEPATGLVKVAYADDLSEDVATASDDDGVATASISDEVWSIFQIMAAALLNLAHFLGAIDDDTYNTLYNTLDALEGTQTFTRYLWWSSNDDIEKVTVTDTAENIVMEGVVYLTYNTSFCVYYLTLINEQLESNYTMLSTVASRLSTANDYLDTIASNSSTSGDYLSSIKSYLSTISGRLYSNSGSAAYWLYQVYTSLSDSSADVTAINRLTSINTELANILEALENLDVSVTVSSSDEYNNGSSAYWSYMVYKSLDDSSGSSVVNAITYLGSIATASENLLEIVGDIYDTLGFLNDDDEITLSIVNSSFVSSDSTLICYPVSVEETDDGCMIQVYYSVTSNNSMNFDDAKATYLNFVFSDGTNSVSESYTVSGSDASGYLDYSFTFIPSYATISVTMNGRSL